MKQNHNAEIAQSLASAILMKGKDGYEDPTAIAKRFLPPVDRDDLPPLFCSGKQSLLYRSAETGDANLLRILLGVGFDAQESHIAGGCSPRGVLEAAVQSGSTKAVELLIEAGAEVGRDRLLVTR